MFVVNDAPDISFSRFVHPRRTGAIIANTTAHMQGLPPASGLSGVFLGQILFTFLDSKSDDISTSSLNLRDRKSAR